MTDDEMAEAGIKPVKYQIKDGDVHVEWRGTGLWAVTRRGACLNRDGQWEFEPLPSNRDQAFFDRCRYTLDEALRAALHAS